MSEARQAQRDRVDRTRRELERPGRQVAAVIKSLAFCGFGVILIVVFAVIAFSARVDQRSADRDAERASAAELVRRVERIERDTLELVKFASFGRPLEPGLADGVRQQLRLPIPAGRPELVRWCAGSDRLLDLAIRYHNHVAHLEQESAQLVERLRVDLDRLKGSIDLAVGANALAIARLLRADDLPADTLERLRDHLGKHGLVFERIARELRDVERLVWRLTLASTDSEIASIEQNDLHPALQRIEDLVLAIRDDALRQSCNDSTAALRADLVADSAGLVAQARTRVALRRERLELERVLTTWTADGRNQLRKLSGEEQLRSSALLAEIRQSLSWLSIASVAGALVVLAVMLLLIRRAIRLSRAQVSHLVDATRRAESAAQVKARFLANMSHEIRTPMNGILGMAEMLAASKLEAEQQQMAATVRDSADALLAILNDILDHAKLEAGQFSLDLHPFSLADSVSASASLMAPQALEKGVEVVIDLDPRIARQVRGDGHRVRQVLLNFVGNAVKFTKSGYVKINACVLAERPGWQRVHVEVADTGVGIHAGSLPTLFQPFVQADSSVTRSFGGTGLGLSICKQIIDAMGGEVGVQSERGSGSTFWFVVEFEVTQAAAARLDPVLEGRTVLLVEPSEVVAETLMTHLAVWGARLVHVEDLVGVDAALSEAERSRVRFDQVLIDQSVPRDEQIRVLDRLDREEARPHVCLLQSPVGGDHDRGEVGSRCDAAMLKPVDPEMVVRLIRGRSTAASNDAAPAAEPGLAPKPLGLRVLVAEDNPVNQRVIQGMLRKLGCESALAVDGVEAVEMTASGTFDVILMDCQMPRMGGIEATRSIRSILDAQPGTPRPAIVAVTANAFAQDREECLAAGMDGFMSKPVRMATLRETLVKLVALAP